MPGRTHLAISDARAGDVDGVVRCFLPDLSRHDGSCDFVLVGDQENGQPAVRVIDDFIPPHIPPLRSGSPQSGVLCDSVQALLLRASGDARAPIFLGKRTPPSAGTAACRLQRAVGRF